MLAFIIMAVFNVFLFFTILYLAVSSSLEPAFLILIPLALQSVVMQAAAISFNISPWAITLSYLLSLLFTFLRDKFGRRRPSGGWISFSQYFATTVVAFFSALPFGISLLISIIYTTFKGAES